MNNYYIGRATPLGGGVTNKNHLLAEILAKKVTIPLIDLTLIKRGSIKTLFRLIKAFISRKSTLVLGPAGQMRKVFSHFLYNFNRRAMERSLLIVMGGQFSNIVAADEKYQKWVKHYKMMYVETQSMADALINIGITNVTVFPNCRLKPTAEFVPHQREKQLKCVCFSMIYPEKGIDTALEAAEQLPDVSFEFWGPIRENYKAEFLSAIERFANCKYNGIFTVDGDNVYPMLNQYDLLLFPTRCVGEGVPGTLIEAKIADLPAIVSNVAYNAELVEDGVSGLVMRENTADCLAECIAHVRDDGALLEKLKLGAKASGEGYYLESYIDDFVLRLAQQEVGR